MKVKPVKTVPSVLQRTAANDLACTFETKKLHHHPGFAAYTNMIPSIKRTIPYVTCPPEAYERTACGHSLFNHQKKEPIQSSTKKSTQVLVKVHMWHGRNSLHWGWSSHL